MQVATLSMCGHIKMPAHLKSGSPHGAVFKSGSPHQAVFTTFTRFCRLGTLYPLSLSSPKRPKLSPKPYEVVAKVYRPENEVFLFHYRVFCMWVSTDMEPMTSQVATAATSSCGAVPHHRERKGDTPVPATPPVQNGVLCTRYKQLVIKLLML